jgi:hypothetical protein
MARMSATSAGVVAIVAREAKACGVPSWSITWGASLASEDHSGGGVPWFVGEHDQGVGLALGHPRQVDRGEAEHSYSLGSGGELGGEGEPKSVLVFGVCANGVVANRHGSIGPAEDYDEKTGRRTPATDKVTGELCRGGGI